MTKYELYLLLFELVSALLAGEPLSEFPQTPRVPTHLSRHAPEPHLTGARSSIGW